ncbi:MAG: type II secretion system F family protein, partial [Planctomycetota bacterium]|nr:type II secretion system F family protein [Planctomycetota bacterium]
MAKFAAQYATADGKIENEVIEAPNERAAAAQLESAGYTPIALRSQSASGGSGAKAVRTVRGGKRMRRALIDFTHQLAAITESGIPMVGGLKAVRDQTENAQLRNAIGRIVNRVEGGRGLAESLDAEPETFPDIYVKT